MGNSSITLVVEMFSKEREDLVVPDEGVAGIDDPVVLLREAEA